jgi:rod shape-determining protein MreB
MEVKGRHMLEGKPITVTLNDREVREALEDPDSPDHHRGARRARADSAGASADICDAASCLSGGGALLQNMDERLRRETGLPVRLPRAALVSRCSAPARCCRISTC